MIPYRWHTDTYLPYSCSHRDLFRLFVHNITCQRPRPIYDIAWHTHFVQRPAYPIFARTETYLKCYLFTTSYDVHMSCRDLQRHIDRSLLQNIVSFIGLFCKRENVRLCTSWMRMSCRDLQRYLRHTAWCTYVTQRPVLAWHIDRSLLQNIVSVIGLFCKRDLYFYTETYLCMTYRSHIELCFLFASFNRSLLQNIVSFIGLFCKRDL